MREQEQDNNNTVSQTAAWVFGYGSLIWRPDIPHIDSCRAELPGYSRRFWQGSHDHRGVPEQPGRVVTLIPDTGSTCVGVAYLVPMDAVRETFEKLDHREKNGYQRFEHNLMLSDQRCVQGLVYIAERNNFAYLGEASIDNIAAQIARSHGPSGSNSDYLYNLAAALRKLSTHDAHVFELESRVRQLTADT